MSQLLTATATAQQFPCTAERGKPPGSSTGVSRCGYRLSDTRFGFHCGASDLSANRCSVQVLMIHTHTLMLLFSAMAFPGSRTDLRKAMPFSAFKTLSPGGQKLKTMRIVSLDDDSVLARFVRLLQEPTRLTHRTLDVRTSTSMLWHVRLCWFCAEHLPQRN